MNYLRNVTLFVSIIAFISMGCNATRSQKGAIIGGSAGAVGGAIIGKAAGNQTLGTVIGAAVGGTAGAIIGRDMDKQAEEIKQEVPGAEVERVGEGIRIEFSEKVLFGFDKSVLGTQAKSNLDDLIKILNRYPNTDIEIQGHTDSTGSDEYNMGLSQRRASAVADYLKENGITSSRISTKAFGRSAPAYPNDTPEHMAQNRRVEFLITANETMREQAEREAKNQ